MNYHQIISRISKDNYKFYLNTTRGFLNSYFESRKSFLEKLKKKNFNSKLFKKSNTLKKLYNLGQKDKKYINLSIANLYKKIEIFQKVYSDYNNFFNRKKNNTEAEIESYVLINRFILQSKRLNDLKKLNASLKINDKVLMNFKKIKDQNCLNILKQNIMKEFELIRKFNV
tara:strand:- start:101 stop:613 length:513 start_codon:yes stop_codon:yes gene_type:complete